MVSTQCVRRAISGHHQRQQPPERHAVVLRQRRQSLTSLGLVIAAHVRRIESMMGLMQMLLLPLSFLSGAMYPLSGLPAWLEIATLLNPITYAVYAIRTTDFSHIE